MRLKVDCRWNLPDGSSQESTIEIFFEDYKGPLYRGFSKRAQEGVGAFFSCPDYPLLLELEKLFLAKPTSPAFAVFLTKGFQFFKIQEKVGEYLSLLATDFRSELLAQTTLGFYALASDKPKEFYKLFPEEVPVLKAYYPRRRVFHVSEALSFHDMWGLYFVKNNAKEQAQKQLQFCRYLTKLLELKGS